jgi:uncharacterized membrane protein YfcA
LEILDLLPLIFLAFAIGGTIKGALGFGMPLTTMSLLSAFLDVPTAAALNALPMLCANIFQANRGGLLVATLGRFWPLLIALAIGTWMGATLIVSLDPRWLLGVLGAIVVVFCTINHFHPRLRLPDRRERAVGIATGFIAGITGGLSTVHGPPLIMYAASLRLAKEAFVAALGTFFLMGGIFVIIAFVERGILNRETAPWSLLCVLPVLAGMWLGQRFARRVDQERFRKAVMIVLLLLGLNLIRRAVW